MAPTEGTKKSSSFEMQCTVSPQTKNCQGDKQKSKTKKARTDNFNHSKKAQQLS